MRTEEHVPASGFRAFISYQHDDSVFAKQIHRVIERYRLPKRLREADKGGRLRHGRLYPVFLYEYDSVGGRSLEASIEEYVRQSESLVVVFSSANTFKSPMVPNEIDIFVKEHGADRVVPVVVEGEHPGCIPKSVKTDLAATPYIEWRKDRTISKRENRLKLIARVADVSFEDLLAQDIQRRTRWKLAGVASLSVFLCVLTLSIVVMNRQISNARLAQYHSEGIIDVGIYNSQLVASRDGELEQKLDAMLEGYFHKVSEEGDGSAVEALRSATFLQIDAASRVKSGNYALAITELDEAKAKIQSANLELGGKSSYLLDQVRRVDTLEASVYVEGQHNCFEGERLMKSIVEEPDKAFRDDYEENPSRMAVMSFEYASCLAARGMSKKALDVMFRSIQQMLDNYDGNESIPEENLVMLLRSFAGANMIAKVVLAKEQPDLSDPRTKAFFNLLTVSTGYSRQKVAEHPDNIMLADQYGTLLLLTVSTFTSLHSDEIFEDVRPKWRELSGLLDREVKSQISCQCLLPYKKVIEVCKEGSRGKCVEAMDAEQANILKSSQQHDVLQVY